MSLRAAILVSFAAMLGVAAPAQAQRVLDRANPGNIEADKRPDVIFRPDQPQSSPARPSSAGPAETTVMAGAIALSGLQALSPADFTDIIAAYAGRTLSPIQLTALVDQIANRARDRGYVFASAWIDPQRMVAGVLRIQVDEGRIDAIRFDGPAHPAARAALQPLITGRPVTMAQLERRLLLAGDIDGVYLRRSRFVREDGKGVLVVAAVLDRVRARATVSNEGTQTIGPVQARFDVDFRNLFASDDAVALTYSATPTEPRELQYGRIRYTKRISPDGTEIALTASLSESQPGAYLKSLQIDSRSWFVGASVLHPLSRGRETSLWLQGELGVRDLAQKRAGRVARHDHITAARMGLYGFRQAAGGRLRINATASRGLPLFGATRAHDPLASRDDADGSFTEIVLWTDWTRSLTKNASLRLAVQSQVAFEPLLVTEELGLGGTGFLRAYDYSERTGDQGAAALAELRYDIASPLRAIKSAQLYAFVDGGRVTNLANGFGSGSLASLGGGIRAALTRTLNADLEIAAPLSGPRYDTGNRSLRVRFRIAAAL